MATSYLLGYEPNVSFQVIATVGDVIGTKPDGSDYRFVGIPDGLGAFDNGDGTITVVMNHEIGATQGIVREHGAKGAFVSQWVLNKSDLSVVSTEDAIKQIKLYDDATDSFVDATYAIARLCSADLAPVSAYQWTDAATGITYGTSERIFATGEETGAEGKEFGVVLTGDEAGIAYELAHLGLFSWENAISSPFAQKKTINIGMDDSTPGQVYVYIGEKQTDGNVVEKAGLVGGKLYGVKALNLSVNADNESDSLAASGRFELVDEGDVSELSGAQLQAKSESLGVTEFLRPEDGQFDPTNPNVFYFVTTASFTGQSRLYKLTFDDITNPETGGTIEAVLSSSDLPVNGTVGPRMMDNLTVTAEGKVIIQEDPGSQSHLAKVFEYDPVTDTLTVIAEHNPALYVAGAPGFKTIDEESSGVIDVTELLDYTGGKAYLLDVQSHNALVDPELVQDGQFLAMYVADVKNGKNGSNDIVNGDAGDNKLLGGSGNDTINGGSGDDLIKGQAGDDIIIGGAGADALTGGAGADIFRFLSTTDSKVGANDRVADFSHADGDKIDLSFIDADSTLAGAQDFVFVSKLTGAAGEVAVRASGNGKYFVEADVNGGGADFSLYVKADAALHADDFILI